MRVLYKWKEILEQYFFACIFIFAAFQIHLYGQNGEKTSPPKSFDWTLPFTLCGKSISVQTNTKQIASDNEQTVYISNSNGTIESIDVPENENNWTAVLGTEIISNISLDNKNIYIVSKSESEDEYLKLRAISKLTGITNWQKDLRKTPGVYLEASGNLFVFADAYLLVIDPEDGSTVTEVNEQMDSSEKSIYLKFQSSLIHGLNLNISENHSKESAGFFINNGIKTENITGLTQNSENLIFGSKNGEIHSYNKLKGKKLWSGKAGGEITSLTFFEENKILIGSMDNFLYLFSTEEGNLIWKRRLPGRLTEKPLIRDRVALVANTGSSTGFIIELEKGKVINQISLPDSVYFIGNSLLVNKRIIVPTNRGVLVYTRESC